MRVAERVTLDTLDVTHPVVTHAVQACRDWAQRKRNGYTDASLVFSGPVGTGKTHLAQAVLWSIHNSLEDGTPVAPVGRFYVANDIIQALDPQTRPNHLVHSDLPILVIDDIGSEQNIPYVSADDQANERRRRYFAIINHCYTLQISLVLTSNLSLARLETHLGRRAWSRLQEMAPKGFMIDLSTVPDWRRKRSGRTEEMTL
jgi:DNA replication protein DnaC